jgi:hypothetical protein
MKPLRSEFLWYLLMAGAASLTGCGSPGYNNNPSQQSTDDRIGCLAATDFFAVYFSVHLQPSDLGPDAIITPDLFRSYCNDIPTPGNVFFTADLVGSELRTIPVAIRVIDQGFRDGDRDLAEGPDSLGTVAEMPATVYSKGFIETSFPLERNGRYAVELIRNGEAGAQEKDILRIPLNVGMGADAKPLMKQILTKVSITAGVLLFCFSVFRILRARKII